MKEYIIPGIAGMIGVAVGASAVNKAEYISVLNRINALIVPVSCTAHIIEKIIIINLEIQVSCSVLKSLMKCSSAAGRNSV